MLKPVTESGGGVLLRMAIGITNRWWQCVPLHRPTSRMTARERLGTGAVLTVIAVLLVVLLHGGAPSSSVDDDRECSVGIRGYPGTSLVWHD